MIGDDLDALPPGVEQRSNPSGDGGDLRVEPVDDVDFGVVAEVVDLAGFGPRGASRVAQLRGIEHLHAGIGQQRAEHTDGRVHAVGPRQL